MLRSRRCHYPVRCGSRLCAAGKPMADGKAGREETGSPLVCGTAGGRLLQLSFSLPRHQLSNQALVFLFFSFSSFTYTAIPLRGHPDHDPSYRRMYPRLRLVVYIQQRPACVFLPPARLLFPWLPTYSRRRTRRLGWADGRYFFSAAIPWPKKNRKRSDGRGKGKRGRVSAVLTQEDSGGGLAGGWRGG